MELNQLKCFITVARTENISKAAKELFISQPALSRVILRLEEELGTPLFDRNGRKISLNDHGRLFLSYVGPGLSSILSGVSALQDKLTTREILIHNYLHGDLIKAVVDLLEALNPALSFRNVPMLQPIHKEQDSGQKLPPDIVFLPFPQFHDYVFPVSFQERWCLIHRDDYVFQTEVTGNTLALEQLTQEPVMLSGSWYDRQYALSLFQEKNLLPNLISCDSLQENGSQINRGEAVGLIPVMSFRQITMLTEQLPLKLTPIRDCECTRPIYMGCHPNFLGTEGASEILSCITDHLNRELAKAETFYLQHL